MTDDRSPPPGAEKWSVAEFFAQALAIEIEASERYDLLADQMEVHNNREIAEIFRKMARIEAHHRDEIERRAAGALVGGKPATFSWIGPSGPEAIDFEDAHYLMTPQQALRLARINEERAAAYFATIAASAQDAEVRAFAREMAEDERQHVVWVDEWIAKFGAEEQREDPDPAVYQE